ncbi:BRD4-interacting chromatin-remodeling complex-associated protein-like [Dasypus novemcinctus]|uniref:BRD4-interacting chromatin-remodeling complex-associated protein-like n=1 Tax=Dasypus novemcinctus TaxID=9361 RepID=UPI0026600C59|nr:BRD4-interacting chromatin-remodeling complex-associated protein-like [Dasypus novemcinctus]XP_058162738.1 BRD4-interacting chromatin-remodeling complex-associated protein-like [Dasypus novemcinctus]XP_058162739.1 BRD4-interacting chromatin-remodeling complex-associated protein-like [Dasypus novemcinctus]
MDDDDDSCLLDLIGDPQALNYFLHGPSNKSNNDDLTNAGYSAANSNSIFANSSNADPKSSLKGVSNQLGEGPSDGLPLSSSLQFLEDELESSPLPDLSEDQPFDILQKSLQEANITEQTLAEEAYLDASIASSQQFAQAQLHPSSSASFTQASNVSNYSGQTLQPIGVTHVPVGTSFASNTVGVQHGFMQHVGISVPSQHLSNSSQISGSGQIQLIGSFSNQPSMMTINNLDGSQIILKGSGQQAPSNVGGGLLVHRQTPNGNSLFGNSSSSPVAQPVTVPFNSTNFQTSLPVHNIIIQRGLAPNSNKVPINIQPKPIQMGQQNTYNVNNLGIQQHHVQQGISFASANSPQGSVVGPHMSVNIVNQQNSRKPVTSQAVSSAGGSIVIHSPMGQPHAPQSQFLIPTSLSVSSNSVHHVQTINGQLLQTQPSQLISGPVASEHVMLNRNSSNMLRTNQPYSGQMLNNQNTAIQLVPGQTFAASGSPVIVNHASPQIVGGQMPLQQASPTVLHLSPGQSSVSQGRPGFTTMPSVTSMSGPSRFPNVSSSSTAHPSLGSAVQSGASGSNFTGDQLTQQPNRTPVPVSVSHRLPVSSSKSTSTFSNTPGAGNQQQFFCQAQKKSLNQTSPISASKTTDGLRQAQIPGLLSTALPGQDSGSKIISASLGTTQPQPEKIVGSSPGQPPVQVDSHTGGQKRPATKQLTKGAFILQQLQRDQAHAVTPDKSQFHSLSDAVQRLLSYHVCQGSMPTEEDLWKVDNEFETVATQLLKRTQAMLNKYRCLLLEDAMRINPSAEMVMIDRMFNQEERASLSRDKRLALVDPDGFQADFCCSFKLDKAPHETHFGRSDQHGSKTTSSFHLTAKAQSRDRAKPGMAEPTNHDQLHLVPNHIVVSAEGNISKKTECLGRALKFDKAGLVQYRSTSEEKSSRRDSVKASECPPGPEGHRKTSSRPDYGPESQLSSTLADSHLEMTRSNSFQDKTLRNSPKNEVLHTDIMKASGEPQPALQLTKSLETTFKNILELKKAGRQSQSDPAVSGSVELDFPNFSPMASQENCLEKFIPDHSEGVVETDSILEAAVNSILEC